MKLGRADSSSVGVTVQVWAPAVDVNALLLGRGCRGRVVCAGALCSLLTGVGAARVCHGDHGGLACDESAGGKTEQEGWVLE